jgi:hypothetical protein
LKSATIFGWLCGNPAISRCIIRGVYAALLLAQHVNFPKRSESHSPPPALLYRTALGLIPWASRSHPPSTNPLPAYRLGHRQRQHSRVRYPSGFAYSQYRSVKAPLAAKAASAAGRAHDLAAESCFLGRRLSSRTISRADIELIGRRFPDFGSWRVALVSASGQKPAPIKPPSEPPLRLIFGRLPESHRSKNPASTGSFLCAVPFSAKLDAHRR